MCNNGLCGGNWLWIIILFLLGNNGSDCNGCNNGCGDNNWIWIILLLLLGNNGCGCDTCNECGNAGNTSSCGCC